MLLHKKLKFSIKDFFSKCDQIRSFLRIYKKMLLILSKSSFRFQDVQIFLFLFFPLFLLSAIALEDDRRKILSL